jgi:uncharacterized membrane protein YqjE
MADKFDRNIDNSAGDVRAPEGRVTTGQVETGRTTVSHHDNRSLGELFTDLTRDFTTLFRKEITLAKVELTEKATEVAKSAAMLAVGGFIAYAGFLALLAAAIIALAYVVPWWLSALIVALVVLLVGYILVQSGLNKLKSENLAPHHTQESLKEDAEWAKEQVR